MAKFKRFILAMTLSIVLVQCRPGLSEIVYFNDTASDLLKLGSSFYELGLSKTDGGIVYITDKATGKQVSMGNLKGCLWRATFSISISQTDACAFSPGGVNAFSYIWSTANRQLTLSYLPDKAAAKQAAVTVVITASEDHWLEMQLTLDNHWGYALGEVAFPADLALPKDNQTEALLPILPGVALNPGFFSQNRDYQTAYMGFPGVFADFMAFSSGSGSLALYSIMEADRFTPVKLGFNFTNCAPSNSVCYTHAFQTTAKNGSQWISPRLRLRVAEARLDSVMAFRVDDGLAAAATIQAKSGDLYTRLAMSPLYKADSCQLNLAYQDYPALLAQIAYPGILHVMGYEPDGFDRNYPDMLPPDPKWGSTQDMAAMFAAAQKLGFLTMPYINPTWWDGESPTLKNLPSPLTLDDVTIQNVSGGQIEECYGCPDNPHRGYVMSPYVPFVQQRLSQLMQQMKQEIPSDFVFEDQIGARAAIFDYNPASPSADAYTQDWIEHTRTYASAQLMTESFFDALINTEIGFNGSILLQERTGLTDGYWGKGNWQVYPLATMLARDKAFFYQHNLAPETFTSDKTTLAWNAAMGYNLSYDLFPSGSGSGVNDPFINVVGAFQRFVLAQYASQRILGYTSLQANVTQTSFENVTVVTNWDANQPYPAGDAVIAPSGMLIKKNDNSLVAGVFSRYNGAALSSGDHYLIEERSADAIILRQPMGADTQLTLKLLPGWKSSTNLEAWAYDSAGQKIAKIALARSGNDLTFTFAAAISGNPVAYYQIDRSQ